MGGAGVRPGPECVSFSEELCLWPQLAGGKPELEADFKKEGRES